ncbi:PIG-L family deacetylase [Flavisolibacter ginsengisoli]|jgi:LmbE family N-acetylglucosaminyl deacetylase|uniref:N-acetylglucosaminyl deacetylase, LmbE family n=1 Tax=Flavisolibacter ginsengisoli DSM 18119 TaxID=1121884 RepID=A0A1M4U8N3_9BACT|nr:PIG-L family deacetylase [Flavisolibacter ginsengisoli]SHE52957.1 N-acetylglucosaminyl deacetylase, LmbE family [Flavisolibacter ginsengisoli DSM 18119]
MKKALLAIVCFCYLLPSIAQTNYTSADIYLGLKKLNVLGSVLYIAAHPDDENTRLLAYLSKEKLYRTGYLSLTRGDGGQNLIGDEQGISLGLVRTQELLAARRIDGAEQFFTRAYDFGYSKTPEETFTKWNREKILSDVVWVIRKFQPDVIITRFPTTGEGGHGHHTASAILANEAFTAAADPKRFPEQLKYVQPWQAKRILWNTFNFGSTNTTNNSQFHFDVGGYNAVLGKSYGEIAALGRSQHKSQGFGVPASRGEAFEFFKTTGGSEPSNDLMDDVNTSWQRVPGSAQVEKKISGLIANFDFVTPQKSVAALLDIRNSLLSMPEGYWRNRKLAEIEKLVEQAGGLFIEATSDVQNAVQGDSLKVNFLLNNRSGIPVSLAEITVENVDTIVHSPLAPNQNLSISKSLLVSNTKSLSQPYWLKEKMEEGIFQVNDQLLIGQPDITPAYVARFNLLFGKDTLSVAKPVQYKHTDPVKGELYEPVFVIPPMTVYSSPDVVLFQKGKLQSKEITLVAAANKNIVASSMVPRIRSANFDISQKQGAVSISKNNTSEYSFMLSNEKLNKETDYVQPFADFTENGQDKYAYLAMTSINYDHIPTIRYFYSDGVKLLNIDLKTSGKKVGYIVGAGDKVPAGLEQMGYEVTLLGDKELSRNHLDQYDAIITGIRAYNTNDWMNNHYDKLMKYVQNGGNLIVQYNTSNNIGPVRAKIAPYDLTITRNRITDENAAVSFIDPNHPVLHFPNEITANDFKDWVQERSIYHGTSKDTAFRYILRMNDPGEAPDDGSLMISKYGKGYFTYTGLVFFRELPAGVPGAYRLLANIIALNRKKEF